jgi:hypothetical protein
MSISPEQLRRNCPKSLWSGAAKTCQWCNCSLLGKATKRRRTWCSDECFIKYQDNHVWSHAKTHALDIRGNKCAAKNCNTPHDALKVFHKTPLPQERYGLSCAHHQENLIVLCGNHRKQYKHKIFI